MQHKEVVGGKLKLKKPGAIRKTIQKPGKASGLRGRPEPVPAVAAVSVPTKEEAKPATVGTRKTPAELKFERALKDRSIDRIDDRLKQTHRQRIEDYNKKLAKLPEHFDIPRVGPG